MLKLNQSTTKPLNLNPNPYFSCRATWRRRHDGDDRRHDDQRVAELGADGRQRRGRNGRDYEPAGGGCGPRRACRFFRAALAPALVRAPLIL